MLALLKLIQSIIKTLHSDGTPGQVAAGIALGSALGLTPLMNLHNLVIFSFIVILNVSFGGGMLGWALFVWVKLNAGLPLTPPQRAAGWVLLVGGLVVFGTRSLVQWLAWSAVRGGGDRPR